MRTLAIIFMTAVITTVIIGSLNDQTDTKDNLEFTNCLSKVSNDMQAAIDLWDQLDHVPSPDEIRILEEARTRRNKECADQI